MGTNRTNVILPHVAVIANRISYDSGKVDIEIYLLKNVADDEAIEQAELFCLNNGLTYRTCYRCTSVAFIGGQ